MKINLFFSVLLISLKATALQIPYAHLASAVFRVLELKQKNLTDLNYVIQIDTRLQYTSYEAIVTSRIDILKIQKSTYDCPLIDNTSDIDCNLTSEEVIQNIALPEFNIVQNVDILKQRLKDVIKIFGSSVRSPSLILNLIIENRKNKSLFEINFGEYYEEAQSINYICNSTTESDCKLLK